MHALRSMEYVLGSTGLEVVRHSSLCSWYEDAVVSEVKESGDECWRLGSSSVSESSEYWLAQDGINCLERSIGLPCVPDPSNLGLPGEPGGSLTVYCFGTLNVQLAHSP